MKPTRRMRLAKKAAARRLAAMPRLFVWDGPAHETRVYVSGALVERRPHVYTGTRPASIDMSSHFVYHGALR